MNTQIRFFELDLLRGLAVVLMVIFHFGYDLALFGYASYDTTVDREWIIFRAVIVTMFLLAVGMSAYTAYAQSIEWNKLLKRGLKLLFVSVAISIGSYLVFPQSWIYFGVIHFILVASFAVLPFLNFPKFSLFLGVFIVLSYVLGYFHLDVLLDYSVENFHIPRYTVDVVSFTPWFGVVLIGVYLMHKRLFDIRIKQNRLWEKVGFLGKHSLLIYLVHQPVFFAIFEILKGMK